eukprot:CAMPEP_0194266458 /NCGR_PEP_ID=MMETSP0169-20130528/1347_1 /TAXON_ID=218684 /ORGANISM="Corethron pennatum, Strain L29A3" /LENGTH=609 /DNA_ID=CAMNT_0039007139 /DNA_START=209 /DNA_END=2038 /DNA_ORIENTATION=-
MKTTKDARRTFSASPRKPGGSDTPSNSVSLFGTKVKSRLKKDALLNAVNSRASNASLSGLGNRVKAAANSRPVSPTAERRPTSARRRSPFQANSQPRSPSSNRDPPIGGSRTTAFGEPMPSRPKSVDRGRVATAGTSPLKLSGSMSARSVSLRRGKSPVPTSQGSVSTSIRSKTSFRSPSRLGNAASPIKRDRSRVRSNTADFSLALEISNDNNAVRLEPSINQQEQHQPSSIRKTTSENTDISSVTSGVRSLDVRGRSRSIQSNHSELSGPQTSYVYSFPSTAVEDAGKYSVAHLPATVGAAEDLQPHSTQSERKQESLSPGRLVFTNTDESEPTFEDVSSYGKTNGRASLSEAMHLPDSIHNDSQRYDDSDSMLLEDRSENDPIIGLLDRDKDNKEFDYTPYPLPKNYEKYQALDKSVNTHANIGSSVYALNQGISKAIEDGFVLTTVTSLIDVLDVASLAFEDGPAVIKAQSEGFGEMCVGACDAFGFYKSIFPDSNSRDRDREHGGHKRTGPERRGVSQFLRQHTEDGELTTISDIENSRLSAYSGVSRMESGISRAESGISRVGSSVSRTESGIMRVESGVSRDSRVRFDNKSIKRKEIRSVSR